MPLCTIDNTDSERVVFYCHKGSKARRIHKESQLNEEQRLYNKPSDTIFDFWYSEINQEADPFIC